MIVQLLKDYQGADGKVIKATTNGKPTIIDLPSVEASRLINRYQAKLTHRGEVNYPPKPVAKAAAKATAKK